MIRGLKTVIWIFTREVGRGSWGQLEDFIFLMMFCTSSDETSGMQVRGMETVYVGGIVRVGRPERAKRICANFDVKKYMNVIALLFCSGSEWGGLWFTVEKMSLEFPGLFLMASE